MRLDRSRKAGRYLEWKVAIFSVGAVLAMVGIALEESWMTGTAIVVLASGALIRFLPSGEEAGEGE